MKAIRLGIIGCGGMSRVHGRALTQQVKGYQLVAVCDPQPENLARYQKEIFDPIDQQPPTFADHRDLLAKVDLDAVLIVTPHTQHFAQTMDSLAAGLHVLVEKPMVTSVAEARQVSAAAKRRRRVVMIGFPGTFTPEFGFIRQYISAGKLGAVRLAVAWSAQNWLPLTKGTWRQDPKLSGGGQAYDTGAHMFHGLLYLTGLQLQEVCAQVENCGTPVDINSVATIKFRNGALATATVSGADCVRWDNAIYISGERGSVRTGIHGGKLELWNAEGQAVKYPRVEPVPTLHENFRDCVRGRAENLCPPLWGLRQALLMEAFYRSARVGRPVPVPAE